FLALPQHRLSFTHQNCDQVRLQHIPAISIALERVDRDHTRSRPLRTAPARHSRPPRTTRYLHIRNEPFSVRSNFEEQRVRREPLGVDRVYSVIKRHLVQTSPAAY